MTWTNPLASCLLFILSIQSFAMQELNDSILSESVGQAGLSIDRDVKFTIDEYSVQARDGASYIVLDNINADYSFVGNHWSITPAGTLRLDYANEIHINDFSATLYASKTENIDETNLVDVQTYTLYANSLGDSYDDFTLDISGIEFDDGTSTWQGTYNETSNYQGAVNKTFTIDQAATINLSLDSDDEIDSIFSGEDFAQIVITDDDGNIIATHGQIGVNDIENFTLVFSSPVNHNFIMRATWTGKIKLGGAIEYFTYSN